MQGTNKYAFSKQVINQFKLLIAVLRANKLKEN